MLLVFASSSNLAPKWMLSSSIKSPDQCCLAGEVLADVGSTSVVLAVVVLIGAVLAKDVEVHVVHALFILSHVVCPDLVRSHVVHPGFVDPVATCPLLSSILVSFVPVSLTLVWCHASGTVQSSVALSDVYQSGVVLSTFVLSNVIHRGVVLFGVIQSGVILSGVLHPWCQLRRLVCRCRCKCTFPFFSWGRPKSRSKRPTLLRLG